METITALLSSGVTWLVGAMVAVLTFTWHASAQNSRLNVHDEKIKNIDVRMLAVENSVNALNIAIAEIKVICTEIREAIKNRP